MPEMSRCKSCGEGIYWLESKKTGKKYPVDDENDPTAFHSKTCKKPIRKSTSANTTSSGFTEDDRKLLRQVNEHLQTLANHPIFK